MFLTNRCHPSKHWNAHIDMLKYAYPTDRCYHDRDGLVAKGQLFHDKTSGSSSSRHHDLHRHMYNWMGRVCSEVDVDPQKRLLHINLLEMTADCLALQSLELRPCLNILVSTVNTSVVAYLNHQGGTSLGFFGGKPQRYFNFSRDLKLRAVHIL